MDTGFGKFVNFLFIYFSPIRYVSFSGLHCVHQVVQPSSQSNLEHSHYSEEKHHSLQLSLCQTAAPHPVSPKPTRTSLYSQSVWIGCLFRTFHVNGIIRHTVLGGQLLTLSMHIGLLCVVACIGTLFLCSAAK